MKLKKFAFSAITLASVVALCLGLTSCDGTQSGYTGVAQQADIFTELNARTADAGIMDFTMASYLLSQNTDLTANLCIADGITFEDEQYGIAFRKGSTGLCDKVNSALAALEDTDIAEIAARYGLSENVLDLSYSSDAETDDTDWNYIVSKGTFIIGYTLNPPMAIKDLNTDKLVGFDIDLPIAVFDWINETYGTSITVKFQLIDWDEKLSELNSKSIDCIWNGMTINENRLKNMTISTPYLLNRQCVVIRKSDAEKYNTADSLKNARVVAERGSAGETVGEAIFN